MQKQMPYSFSYLSHSSTTCSAKPDGSGIDHEYGPITRSIYGVMISLESTRSKKQCIRARPCWDGDLYMPVKDLPELPKEWMDPGASMARCHYFWDWMRYAAVLAICEIFLEDEIEYDDMIYFLEILPKPKFSLERNDPEYFEKLTEFAKSIEFRFEPNGF